MSFSTIVKFYCDKCGDCKDGRVTDMIIGPPPDSSLPEGWRRLRMTNETKKRSGWDLCEKCTSHFFQFVEPRK